MFITALLLILVAGGVVNIVRSFGFTERSKSENLAGSLWCTAPLKVQSSQRTAGSGPPIVFRLSYCGRSGMYG